MSYLRQYRLTFGRPYTLTDVTFIGPGARGAPIDNGGVIPLKTQLTGRDEKENRKKNMDAYLSNATNVAIVSELNIEFDIEKKFDASPNTCEITVYNLSDSTVGYLENNAGGKVFIKLEAGYQDEGIKTIFLGNVEAVGETFEGDTRITTIYCTDGGVELKEALISTYYPKGTSYDQMVEDIALQIGLPKGDVIPFGSPYVTKQPVYVVGKAADQLKRLAENAGYLFTIQDLAINIVPEKKPIQRQCALISSSTGLIGSPSLIDESQTKPAEEQGNKGIKFKTLLNGAIVPNEIVTLDTKKYKGQYKVTKVKHLGEYEGDSWFSEVEAQEFAEVANADE